MWNEDDKNSSWEDPHNLRLRDEILQLMYWMHGEGLSRAVTADEMLCFLAADRPVLLRCLEELGARGYVEPVAGESFRLTELGLHEGKRRFLDEFEPMLRRGGHGECNEPDCGCHEAESSGASCSASKNLS